MSCLIHGYFKCIWCPSLNKCSTGRDRKRQDWLQKGCDKSQIEDSSHCPAIGGKGNNNARRETQEDAFLLEGKLLHETQDVKQEPLAGPSVAIISTTPSPSVSTATATVTPPAAPASDVAKDKLLVGVNGTGQPEEYSDEEIIDNLAVADAENMAKITLGNHNYNNFTQDYHDFYNSTMVVDDALAKDYWASFKDISANTLLSNSHRKAVTVQLSFDFPFFGHLVNNVTVLRGGLLYTGQYVHSWLAATQYIAPLMANFDPSLSNDSFVKFADNGTAFTVIWENVFLQDREDIGSFTFSTTLHKTGDIVFAYFSVPIPIASIQDNKHPVKIGLSDAYIIDAVVLSRHKTIYEDRKVNSGNQEIQNSTVISFIYQSIQRIKNLSLDQNET